MALKPLGFVQTRRGVFSGKIKVFKNNIDVELIIKDPFFGNYPIVRVINRSQLGDRILSHIEGEEDHICYKSSTGLILDLTNPASAILLVLKRCKETLEFIFNNHSNVEISKEYQFYWKSDVSYRLFNLELANNAFTPSKMFFAESTDGATFFAINREAKLSGYQIKAASDLMLYKLDTDLFPVNNILQPKNLSDLQTWLVGQQKLDKSIFHKVVDYLSRDKPVMFIANNAIIGFELEDKNIYKGKGFRLDGRLKLMQTKKAEVKLRGIRATKCDLASVVGRNNTGFTTLEGKNIALIGCGTIGGHLSKMLVQSGCGLNGNLTIVDKEILSIGNIGRHILGIEHVGESKAKGVKKELQKFHPDINITELSIDALEIWNTLITNDLIIDATGDENFQNALNQLFMSGEDDRPSAIIHSWILLNGVAVQSFLNAKDNYACFRCLRPDIQQPARFEVVKDYHNIKTVAASCGDGDFIPFSVDVSHVAASLANRAAIDWASGEPGPRLRTIITDFKSENIINRKPNNPSKSPHCPICGGMK